MIGNCPELLKFFPEKPEYYHNKKDHPDDDSIGPFGSAENEDDELRAIDEEEAREVGLLDGSYPTTTLDEAIPEFLCALNADRSDRSSK